MKKLSFIALASILIVAVGTGMAFAAAYDVTTNFGVRVTEKGISEQVGSTTLTPANNENANAFVNGQIITVELLGKATISHTIVADYAFGNPAAVDGLNGGTQADVNTYVGATAAQDPGYRVIAVEGNDFFIIQVTNTGAALLGTDVIIYGHEDASRICVDLSDTIYNSADPAQQLVKASYADNLNNTFSGDTDIATVKPKSVQVAVCDKSNVIDIYDFTGQGPSCGPIQEGSFCLTFEDTATSAFQDTDTYVFALGKKEGAKAGVGIGTITIEDDADPANVITPAAGDYTRYDRLGNEIVLADFDDDADFTATQKLYAATAYVEVNVTFAAPVAGPQKYTLKGTLYQDTCLLTPGDYMIDLMANKVPCGASFSETDILAAEFVTPTVGGVQVFPYAVANAGTWFNGLVITNPSTTSAVTVSFIAREADGDTYTGSVSVPAGGMEVGFAADVMNPTTTGSDEAFGDEPYAIYATGSGAFYGFIFIGNGTMAQGYLPIMPVH